MSSLIWVPIIGGGSPSDLIRPNVPAGVSFSCVLGLDKTQANTVPIQLANDSDAALCTASIQAAQVPAADMAYYTDQLVQRTDAGIFTQAQAEALATAAGISLDS